MEERGVFLLTNQYEIAIRKDRHFVIWLEKVSFTHVCMKNNDGDHVDNGSAGGKDGDSDDHGGSSGGHADGGGGGGENRKMGKISQEGT